MSEMNKGVEILIGRMESHPQEFQHDVMRGEYGRWANVLAQVMQGDIFSEEERAAVQQALRTTRREQFTKRVIQQLMADPVNDYEDAKKAAISAQMSAYLTAQQAGGLV